MRDGVQDYGPLLEETPTVRVRVVNTVEKVHITVNGNYQITGSLTNVIEEGQRLQKSVVSVVGGNITIGNKHYDNSELRITSLQQGEIEVNDVRYHGKISILRQFNNMFSIIEEVDIERFVAGVLGREMPQSWDEEALSAQAVAIRTYVMYKKKIRRDETYHLDMPELAYRGTLGETPKTHRIAQETKGVVMTYNWHIFPAYFHSTCGGHTEDVRRVFEEDSTPPLSGVACNYCNNSKYYDWKVDLSKSVIEKKLREGNITVENIRTIRAVNHGVGKHGSQIEIVSANGSKKMNANTFRLLIGPNRLYSTAFSTQNNGGSIHFSGNGWGHGVGLCQYGAQSMAKTGFLWKDILGHYYPKIALVRIY
ncbi:MAG: SpoIID/LytB domain-containing protein [Candidatus Brocadiaceae bacterium]|nr:SpoIID/LytB domain-containing protein [Candidatus Brocadiaceae bacterium]